MKNIQRITKENQIEEYFHCARCIQEYQSGNTGAASPAEYSDLSAGWTAFGLQIWCNRHNLNLINVDFEGQQHPAM